MSLHKTHSQVGGPSAPETPQICWWWGPTEDAEAQPGQVSLSLGPLPGVLHLLGLALGEEPEAKEASSILPGPEIPEKLNFIVP